MRKSVLLAACIAGLGLASCGGSETFYRGKVTAYLEAQGYAVRYIGANDGAPDTLCPSAGTFYPFSTDRGNGYACVDQQGVVTLNTLQPLTSTLDVRTNNPPPTED